ncbi:MAG TPA: hypothetical protein VNO34_02005 [Actinomycetota bacterium]|nr:hypothetical protein [Actinomycetota bacterium]
MTAGFARTEAVLEPSFVEGLDALPVQEVRRRRDRALAEREFLSYLRRLLQVHQDLLRAERDRRAAGAPPPDVVERVRSALVAGPRGRGRGEAIRVNLPPEDLDEAERWVDRVLGPALGLRPEELEGEVLGRVLESLEREERAVSERRAAVIRVHDRLQGELRRRYREDPGLIPGPA